MANLLNTTSGIFHNHSYGELNYIQYIYDNSQLDMTENLTQQDITDLSIKGRKVLEQISPKFRLVNFFNKISLVNEKEFLRFPVDLLVVLGIIYDQPIPTIDKMMMVDIIYREMVTSLFLYQPILYQHRNKVLKAGLTDNTVGKLTSKLPIQLLPETVRVSQEYKKYIDIPLNQFKQRIVKWYMTCHKSSLNIGSISATYAHSYVIFQNKEAQFAEAYKEHLNEPTQFKLDLLDQFVKNNIRVSSRLIPWYCIYTFHRYCEYNKNTILALNVLYQQLIFDILNNTPEFTSIKDIMSKE